jgi:hypothetical protein
VSLAVPGWQVCQDLPLVTRAHAPRHSHCISVNDGVCDEPFKCPFGTDTVDCQARRGATLPSCAATFCPYRGTPNRGESGEELSWGVGTRHY